MEPPVVVGLSKHLPSKILVPPLVVTPLLSVGVDAADTTKGVPALDGVLKAMTVLPKVIEYHVFWLHDEA